MPAAQGSCPACGAPIQFGLGSSLAKICDHCKATVLRTDRGLQNLGKVAEIADIPSFIAVGDQGTLSGRHFEVLGRVQLDQGLGPWDEYYVAFDNGNSWGWLAYAQGRWHVTATAAPVLVPAWAELKLEQDILIGTLGYFRVAEIKTGTIRSAEGELPGAFPAGFVRYYADCYGLNSQFLTLDYDDGTKPATLFTGYIFNEPQMVVTVAGPRTVNRVKTTHIKCPSCGGDVPKLGGDRSERLGCPYCGAVSDIVERKLISQQERLLKEPTIPIGSRGTFDSIEYLCLAYVKRSSLFEDERYTWEEFLIFAPQVGYRWLVDDPESGWFWAAAMNPADIVLQSSPNAVRYNDQRYSRRNENEARVDYVLGEVYWKCAVGETVQVTDYVYAKNVLSRELIPGEVNWTFSSPIPWPVVAQSFGLPVTRKAAIASSSGGSGNLVGKAILLLFLLMCCCIIGIIISNADDSTSGTTVNRGVTGGGIVIRSGSSSSYRGGGVYSGGK